jgi:hypothetical protein
MTHRKNYQHKSLLCQSAKFKNLQQDISRPAINPFAGIGVVDETALNKSQFYDLSLFCRLLTEAKDTKQIPGHVGDVTAY